MEEIEQVVAFEMMSEQPKDYVAIRCYEVLSNLKPRSYEACIFKVPRDLRMVRTEAYEPTMISIGPYHRHNDSLRPMEDCKFRYLRSLLDRRNEDSADRYIKAMRDLEHKARSCYAEPVNLSEDDFVEMLVLDGCFVVEVIRKNELEHLRDPDGNDPIFDSRTNLPLLKHDLFLLENQLPFFVLWELFEMTVMPDDGKNFSQLISEFFFNDLPGEAHAQDIAPSPEKVKHLLGFVHDNWLPSIQGLEKFRQKSEDGKDQKSMKPIQTATQIEEAGIKIKSLKNKKSKTNKRFNIFGRKRFMKVRKERHNFFEIEFRKGKLLIPPIKLHKLTETILRNLIAYEHFSKDEDKPDHVLDYTMFMDCLINSTKDVEILEKHGIIHNWLEDYEAVADLFNRLGHNVVHYKKSYYAKTLKKVRKHCEKKTNKLLATLKRDYFNTPWAAISFSAAAFILLLTLLGTIYTVLSYYKEEPNSGN